MREHFTFQTLTTGILLLLVLARPALSQISPGELSRAHAKLEGLTKCLDCHELGNQASDAKCRRCHVAIDERLKNNRGLHAWIMRQQSQKTCSSCHSEHNGREFALVVWENGEENFDHTRTGYPLQGRHAEVQCRQCHQSKNIREKFQANQNVRLDKTFLGLSPSCSSCHADEHRGQLGASCEKCHGEQAWKPAPKFSHNRARFRLTGRHQTVACSKCHPEVRAREKVGNETIAAFAKFNGLEFDNCTACHQDPHRGNFGKDCTKCHNTQGWKNIAGGAFNHDLTDFPLRGKHGQVACEKCHPNGHFRDKPAHAFCTDCHQDAHAGQFAQRPDHGKCESCHKVKGFTPSQFTQVAHQKTDFPLNGSHLAVTCGACHVRESQGKFAGKLLFEFPNQRCHSCHPDVHHGQFGKKNEVKCERCHQTSHWRELSFVHNRDSSFKLDGAHQKVACNRCHFPLELKDKSTVVIYKPLRKECAACHR